MNYCKNTEIYFKYDEDTLYYSGKNKGKFFTYIKNIKIHVYNQITPRVDNFFIECHGKYIYIIKLDKVLSYKIDELFFTADADPICGLLNNADYTGEKFTIHNVHYTPNIGYEIKSDNAATNLIIPCAQIIYTQSKISSIDIKKWNNIFYILQKMIKNDVLKLLYIRVMC